MKEIVLLGTHLEKSLKFLSNATKYKIKQTDDLEEAAKAIVQLDPDFVLCSGKINVDGDGNYFIEI